MHQRIMGQRFWSGLLIFVLGMLALPRSSDVGFASINARELAASSDPTVALVLEVGNLTRPVHVTHAGDESGRLFVVEQRGRIRIVKDGTLLATPFLDITSRVGCCNERGLLSVAFPPNYASKGYFYVNYTDTAGDTVIARYTTTTNPDIADSASETVILAVDQPFSNHNGGQIAFGPSDGYLYIGMGDGGSGGDPGNRAQNTNELLGKLLRIDVESGATPYAVPPTNPYTQTAGYQPEIWALGLRNPWRFSFDRATSDLYIADVGQSEVEEINVQPASSPGGENYGWRCKEGTRDYDMSGNCPQLTLTPPVFEYEHADNNKSITGGFVYRGTVHQALQGVYLYSDFGSGRIWGLRNNNGVWENTLLIDTDFIVTSFGEAEDGTLYVTSFVESDNPVSAVYRITLFDNALYLPALAR